MRTTYRFVKLLASSIALVLQGLSCGPGAYYLDDSMAVRRWQSNLEREALFAEQVNALQPGDNAAKPSETRAEQDSEMRSFPYLVSAAPYYCDPQRYPPQVFLAVKNCQPYLRNIFAGGFPPRIPPGSQGRGRLATNHP